MKPKTENKLVVVPKKEVAKPKRSLLKTDVMFSKKDCQKIARLMGISVEKAKMILAAPEEEFLAYAKKLDRRRFLKLQAVCSKALDRLHERMSDGSYFAIAKLTGILSDKLSDMTSRRVGGVFSQTIFNIGDDRKIEINWTGWDNQPEEKTNS